MAIEAGAKNGIFPVDDVTAGVPEGPQPAGHGRPTRQIRTQSTSGPSTIDLDTLVPTVGLAPPAGEHPHRPPRAGTSHIDQVVIGSCTNGRIEDMEAAAAF